MNVRAPIRDPRKTVPVNVISEYPGKCDVTVVVPMRNEEANVAPVCAELQQVMDKELLRYEVIIVNDGSTDRTADELDRAIRNDPRFTVIELYRSFGQSAALSAGFDLARGEIIVPMDGDLQNDPHDIPKLIAQLETPPGYDIVSGWRKKRQDKRLTRRFPSLVANVLVRRLTWCNEIHDFGCMIKAYRREVLNDVHLYGEMHRFLPALCRWRGARICELVVNHRPRVAGKTKYGLKRTIKVLFDLLTVKFLGDYLTKPIYFFGKLAILTLTMVFLSLGVAVAQKFGYLTEHGVPVNLNNNIFILFAMMMFITTGMLMMAGVVAELLIRIYHESQGRTPYKMRKLIRYGNVQV
ncbi:MAG TPA: glycosyltransferase family 2 protein [Candidatus Udaeobacter sp.]|nr:glycosyltransferase family 2 protein [Candidatus Udaeobacter sp.]